MAPQRSRLHRTARRFTPSPVKDQDTMTVLGRLEAQLTEVYNHTRESDRALRGYDNEPGVVARLNALQDQVAGLKETVADDHVKLEQVIRYQTDYPSFTWMLQKQTSKAVAFMAGALVLGLAAPLVGVRLLTLILHALNVPDPVIDFYLGGS